MPNHIQNRLTVSGKPENVKALLSQIAVEEEGKIYPISFNKITPMPAELNITSGSLGETGLYILFGIEDNVTRALGHKEMISRFAKLERKLQLEAVKLGFKYYDNMQKYNHKTWYTWCNENWGTKWDAYGQPDKRNTDSTIYFKTAWCAPIELIKKLSAQFPLVTLQLDYADEDSGSNTGKIKILNGIEVESYKPTNQSYESYELFFELHEERRSDFILVDGEYQYKEA